MSTSETPPSGDDGRQTASLAHAIMWTGVTPPRLCGRCGESEHKHNGVEKFCPFYSTFRAATEAPDAQPEPRTPDETLAMHLDQLAAYADLYGITEDGADMLRDAAKRLRELAADGERLDWLERMVVNVRSPTPYGSLDVFWASPPDEDDGPSDLRKQIADARQQLAQGGTDGEA